jgi:hypothetical protein
MRAPILLLTLAAACLALAGCPAPRPWQGLTPQKYAQLQTHRLAGIGHMENQGEWHLGLEQFKEVQKLEPALAFGYVNAAAALIGRPNRGEEALGYAEKAVKLLPDAAWPKVVLARAHQNVGQAEKATAALEAALKAAPREPRVIGAMIDHLRAQPGDQTARLYELRKRLAEIAPDNLAVQSHWMVAQAEAGEHQGALATLQRIRELLPRVPREAVEHFPRAEAALKAGSAAARNAVRPLANTLLPSPLYSIGNGEAYGNEQDPANLVMREWAPPPPPVSEPPLPEITVTWSDVTAEAGLSGRSARGVVPVAVGDLTLVPGAGTRQGGEASAVMQHPDLVAGGAPDRLAINEGSRFRWSGAGPGASPAVASPLLVDLNNDYTLDLYVAAPEGDRVWKNARSGSGEAEGVVFSGPAAGVTLTPAGGTPGRGPGSALAVDLDQDGDLDIVRASGAAGQPAIRYLRNNGNLMFTDITAAAGLNFPSQGARQAVFGDFDNRGEPDLFVVQAAGRSRLFLNRRQDVFRDATDAWGIKPDAGAMSAAVADFNRDGRWDLVVAGRVPHGTVLYRNTGSKFEVQALPSVGDADWVAVLDYDNDTWLDLVFAGRDGLKLLRNNGGRFEEPQTVLQGRMGWVRPLDYDWDGDLDLLAATAAGELRLVRNDGGNGRPWLKVELAGYLVPQREGPREERPQANNTYAIGAVLEPQTVWDRQQMLVTEPVTHAGLGRADRAVVVRSTWTNGVPQDRVGPRTAATVRFDQVPGGSCPFLYVWDGDQWRFIGDFNWRSPIGMLFARGVPVPHDQTLDYIKLPGETIRPIGSYYRLIATEELREISYFDMLRMIAVDHPEDTEIYVDERFKMGPPDPFRIHTVARPRLPVSAADGAGRNLLPALKEVDNVFTPVPPGKHRGVCAPHDLVLDLGSVPDPSNVKLFLHGWIYPPPNSTNIATSQDPSVPVIPPTLYVGDGAGGWSEGDRSVGLPCGKRKTIVLDLSNRFRGGDFRVKLTTTMEIRWDAAFFTSGERAAPVRQSLLPLVEADLRERGYSTLYYEVPDGPQLFNYNLPLPKHREPNWPNIAGAYTKLGDCAPLLQEVDDRYAIIGPGDEIRLLFDGGELPPLPPGWKRDFVVMSDGWTKDTDKNTVTGETVEPLPFHGMKRYPPGPDERFPDTPAHRRWMREWNTRIKR